MSSVFRNFVVKPLTIVLFALLIASFALWGIGDIFRGDTGPGVVIQVGDEEISEDEFARNFRREYARVSQAFGGRIDLDTARELGIVDEIVNRTITRALFSQKARDMGLVIDDSQIVQEIRGQTAFRTPDGGFDRFGFEQALREAGLTEGAYIELMRSELQRGRLADAAVGAAREPRAMAEPLYRYQQEARTADYLVIPPERFEVAEPEEHELRQFHEENPDDFMSPEYREVTFIDLSFPQMIEEVEISESDLRAAFEERAEEFGEPERRGVSQIVLDSAEEASAAVEELRNGADLESVAREFTGSGPVDLGLSTRDELPPELAEAAFAATEEGLLEEPVETMLGWHIVRIDEVEAGADPEFEEVREDLRRDLARNRAVDALVSLANELDSELATGATLEQAADFIAVDLQHIDATDPEGRGPDGELLDREVSNIDRFVDVAFDTEPGDQSLLQEADDGSFFVLRVDGVRPPEVRPFEEVRDEVREAYIADRRRQKADELAEELAEEISRGAEISEIAERHGAELRSSEPLRRSGNEDAPDAERIIAGALFGIEPGEAAGTAFEGGVVVAQLKDIQAAEPGDDVQEFGRTRNELRQSLQSELLEQFSAAMREEYPVRVNESRLNRVLNRFQ